MGDGPSEHERGSDLLGQPRGYVQEEYFGKVLKERERDHQDAIKCEGNCERPPSPAGRSMVMGRRVYLPSPSNAFSLLQPTCESPLSCHLLGSVGMRGGNEAKCCLYRTEEERKGSRKGRVFSPWCMLMGKVIATASERRCCWCSKTAPHLAIPSIPSLCSQEGEVLHKPKKLISISSAPGRPSRQLQADEVGSSLFFPSPELALLLSSWKANENAEVLAIKMMQYVTQSEIT